MYIYMLVYDTICHYMPLYATINKEITSFGSQAQQAGDRQMSTPKWLPTNDGWRRSIVSGESNNEGI